MFNIIGYLYFNADMQLKRKMLGRNLPAPFSTRGQESKRSQVNEVIKWEENQS